MIEQVEDGLWVGEGGGRLWRVTKELIENYWLWVARPEVGGKAITAISKDELEKKLKRLKETAFKDVGKNSDQRRIIQDGNRFYSRTMDNLLWTAPFPVETLEDEARAAKAFQEYKETNFEMFVAPAPARTAKPKKAWRKKQMNRKVYRNIRKINGAYIGNGGGIQWKVRHGKDSWIAFPIESSILQTGIGSREAAVKYWEQFSIEGKTMGNVAYQLSRLEIP